MRRAESKRDAEIRADFQAIVGTSDLVVVIKYDKGSWGRCKINGADRPYQLVNAFVRRGLLVLIERNGQEWTFRNVA